MIEPSWLTKHERRVIVAALARERTAKQQLGKRAAKAKTRAMADADVYVASDLLRQLLDR